MFLEKYLLNIYYDNEGVSPNINNINRICILEFLYAQVDVDNSTQFRTAYNDIMVTMIEVFNSEDKEQDPLKKESKLSLIPSKGPHT